MLARQSSEPTIRKALAIGADDAIRVNCNPLDAYFTASQLAAAIGKEGFDIIICGIESSDFNGSAVGGMISEFLGIPSVSSVSGLSIENGVPVLTREIDGGRESVRVPVLLWQSFRKASQRNPGSHRCVALWQPGPSL
jgi:electron transfer flavoprotein beta subunit